MIKQRGFTLIELVVVITILGILAAVALPRFINIQGEARVAKLNAARGAVASASALIHAAFLAKGGVADASACPGGGGTADNTTTLCTENGLISIANGYPASPALGGANPGVVAAAGLSSVLNPSAADLLNDGYVVTVAAGATTVQMAGAVTPANCQFIYTQPAVAGGAPTLTAIDKSGC